MNRFLLTACVVLFLVGCRNTGNRPAPAKNQAPPTAPKVSLLPAGTYVGKVALVKPELRYVLIDFSMSQLPKTDQVLNVYRQGQKVGEVKISGPSRNFNIAADVTAGHLMIGDDVRSN